MRIYGVGTDIVSISRIQSIWDRFGDTFAKRILTQIELTEFSKIAKPFSFLAERLAAKETFVKELSTGFRHPGFGLTDIGVKNNDLGKPELELMEPSSTELMQHGISSKPISGFSDEKDYAVLCHFNF